MVEVQSYELDTLLNTKPFVVVGIPAFNEEQTIANVVLEAYKFADKVIVCDDGSIDNTGKIARCLGAEVLSHEQNDGYGASIKSLFESANLLKADIFVTLDADGQHDPNEIPAVIKPILNGSADIVIGSRFVDKNGTAEMPLYRQFGAKLITKMVNGSAKKRITDAQSGFRAYNCRALSTLNFFENGMSASVEILLNASAHNLRIEEVASTCKYNIGVNVATSSENPLTHGVGVVLSLLKLIVEKRPLLILGIPSLFFLFTGLSIGVWLLQIYSLEHAIITNIALASITFTLIGFFMLSSATTLYAIARVSRKIRA